ncbi:MAG: acyl-CoA desaturase [Halobacteriovoraceae bacterium]|jgi:fatty-acid desaturase|nr:acyl-CoA desaturase [Halobacteriovoraceae bacterium]
MTEIETKYADTSKLRPHWGNIIGISVVHLLALAAIPFFNWSAFSCFLILFFIISPIGVTLTYHRLLSHRSFKVPTWLEYTLATFGALSGQGPVLIWVAEHRLHHRYSDTTKDPHSARDGGFWWSHVTHLFYHKPFEDEVKQWMEYVPDLASHKYYHFLSKYNFLVAFTLVPILYWAGGIPFVMWGFFFRIAFMLHITWFVNSATHKFGYRNFDTSDDSSNLWWVSLLAAGEGWHNNHHAFQKSAKHGIKWWEFDLTWMLILTLEKLGLATNVVRPKLSN